MKTKSKRISRVLVAALFFAGLIVMQFQSGMVAFAAAKTWDGSAGDNLFSTGANWSGNTAPVNGDSIIFDVTGLGANTTITNDIVGLSLVGINFSGDNANFDYTLTGSPLSVSGSIIETSTDNHATNAHIPVINLNLTLTGPTILDNVVVAFGTTLNTNGNSLTLNADSNTTCAATSVSGSLTGNGTLNGGSGPVYVVGNTAGFTGAIVIASTSRLSLNAGAIDGVSSITSNGGRLALQLKESNRTMITPMNLSGTLVAYGGSNVGCSGATATGLTLTDTGSLTLNGNLTFIGMDDTDMNISGAYQANGFTTTVDNSIETGTLTHAADSTPAAPTVPRNLVATPGSTQAGLDWDAPTSNGTQAITDYRVQYKLSTDSVWITFTDGVSTTTATTVTGLTNGQNYDFRVAAQSSVGFSPNVTVSNIPISAVVTAPLAPTGLAGSIASGTGNLVLNWTAPASDGGSAITNYLVEIKLSSSSTWTTVAHAPFTGTSFEITTGITDGQTYDVRVSAINGTGTGPSNAITSFLYNPGDGSTGSIGSAGGSGTNPTIGAPNTGLKLQVRSPFAIILLGIGSVVALLIAFWPRKQNLRS